MESLSTKDFKRMIMESTSIISAKKEYLNYINVFPVRDSDTGNNLLNTLSNVNSLDDNVSLKKFLKDLKEVLLKGARGNSGVILSQFYKGMCDYLMTCKHVGVEEFARSIDNGYETAYKSINKPVDGSMLSVLKGASIGALSVLEKTENIIDVLLSSFSSAQKYLKDTINKLPVLRDSGVVDTGGLGVVYMLGAWLRSLGVVPDYDKSFEGLKVKELENLRVENDEYCVNVLMSDVEHLEELKKLLSSAGNSVEIGGDNDLLRIHLHTNDYEFAENLCSGFGKIVSFEKDNMRLQYEKSQDKNNI